MTGVLEIGEELRRRVNHDDSFGQHLVAGLERHFAETTDGSVHGPYR